MPYHEGRPRHYITIDGETRTITEWAAEYGPLTGITLDSIRHRISEGWDEETAVTKPPKKYRDNHERVRQRAEQQAQQQGS